VSLYTALLRPLLFAFPAEPAHHLGLALARGTIGLPGIRGAVAACHRVADPRLAQTVFGRAFANPVGLAAGLDKNGVAIDALAALGFSHVEIGTVTGQAQPGNPQPRLFRLRADHAIINRMGFNNRGAAEVGARLAARYARRRPGCVLGVNIGKSKVVDLAQALDDYRISVRALAPVCDYLVVNVSSPNTPGLRDLQSEAALRPLLAGVRAELDAVRAGVPLLLKIAPDLADAGIDAAVDVALEARCDGLICTNTTISREGLATPAARVQALGNGGLSGAPLRARSTAALARAARRLAGRAPIIGVGGIDSPAAAWEKICHGASLVQVYTGFIYSGPGLAKAINRGLVAELDRAGLATLGAAVGRAL
jgi:dihydroorotate dehydrogenase